MKFPARSLLHLARRVRNGDVVFFIGTGFSVDSEQNTAARLMRRLLIRMQAMCETLRPCEPDVAADLARMFDVKPEGKAEFGYSDADVGRLSDRYYETNDWFCRGFGQLLRVLKQRPEPERLALWQAMARREEVLREQGGVGRRSLDSVPFDRLPVELLDWLADGDEATRQAGKALFLDTMGFRHERIMGGDPALCHADDVAQSYGNRLLPRHHVIARLAREGFCATTLTTNYDLLLEGAFRLAGFRYESSEPLAPLGYYNEFARIASPAEFFTKGKALRTTTLVKMHGCAQRYRALGVSQRRELAHYLRSMVFTYREIQNWRQDSWAADLLRTLLRTRTVVFSGYSLRDPVIHDTFRTVYEEMARQMAEEPAAGRRRRASFPGGPTATKAPAFFITSVQDLSAFYGMEVLRAATAAVGAPPPPLGQHANYLQFHFRSKPDFPHLDEVFRWLFHLVFRLQQWACLRDELERVLRLLLGGPRPDEELRAVRRAFLSICRAELHRSLAWGDNEAGGPAGTDDRSTRSRQQHRIICGWTDGFGAALLREFACADHTHRCRGPSRQLMLMRSLPWHCPTTHNSGWTCWGAVVEVALRRMISQFAGLNGGGQMMTDEVEPRGVESQLPTVLFPREPQAVLPDALTIRCRGFDALGESPRLWVPVRHRVFWELQPDDAPWPRWSRGTTSWVQARGESIRRAPSARVIWRWASASEGQPDRENLPGLLGAEVNP